MGFLEQVLGAYAPLLVAELVPANHGEFEVQLDGELLFSKLRDGRFPEFGDVSAQLEAALGPPPAWR